MTNVKEMWFVNGAVHTPGGTIERGFVHVSDGRIMGIGRQDACPVVAGAIADFAEIVDLEGAHLVPGFIDVHVHGGGGFDVMSGRAADIDGMSRFHASRGTTAFLATTLTADAETTEKAVCAVKAAMERGTAGAQAVGIHLEGPFLNPICCGAQNPSFIRNASIDELKRYIELSGGTIRLITVAPEMPRVMDVIEYAANQGIAVSIGHSAASLDTVKLAISRGASQITHLFNGMNAFHHREPGVPGAGLMLDSLAVEVICDGIHVHRDLVDYVLRVKPRDKVLAITDCVSASGLPDGDYVLGGLPVVMKAGQVRLMTADGEIGSLAGSSLTMDRVLLNMMNFSSRSLEDILPALTINPAKQIGLDRRKGTIETGKDADLAILDENYSVKQTYVGGRLVQ